MQQLHDKNLLEKAYYLARQGFSASSVSPRMRYKKDRDSSSAVGDSSGLFNVNQNQPDLEK
jgi:hypothetical protein